MPFFRIFEKKFWLTFWKVCSRKEKIIIISAFIVFIFSLSTIFFNNYLFAKKSLPARGGELIEGIVGQVSSLNPVIADFGEANRSLISLVYEGILEPDGQGGYKGGLAKSWKALDNKTVWRVVLKDNIKWQDGQPITTDDIVFTIGKILDPRTRSPLASAWQGVVVKAYDKKIIEFYLKQPYQFFERNLADLKIIPKHIWQNIPVDNYWLTDYNLMPIGSGPFKPMSYQKTTQGTIKVFTLQPYKNYFNGRPYLNKIIFKFYQNYDQAKEALAAGKINSLADIVLSNASISLSNKKIKKILVPRFYGIFLNNQSVEIFKDKNVRKALLLATPKKLILKKVLNNQGQVVNTPFVEGMDGWSSDFSKDEFNLEKAKQILIDDGFDSLDENGTREKARRDKTKEKLKFELVFPSSPLLFKVASIIKDTWAKIGVDITLKSKSIDSLREENIFPRCYEAVLLGEISSIHPDLFSFWHSSQKFDPGLNISLFDNEKADKLIEQIRKTDSPKQRKKDYYKFQEILLEENPVIFLFSPSYFWLIPNDLNGLNYLQKIDYPFERFVGAQNWYMKETRM